MMNNDINSPGNTEADRLQAACRKFVAQRQEQETVNPGYRRSRFDNQVAHDVVQAVLKRKADDMDALEAGRDAGPMIDLAGKVIGAA